MKNVFPAILFLIALFLISFTCSTVNAYTSSTGGLPTGERYAISDAAGNYLATLKLTYVSSFTDRGTYEYIWINAQGFASIQEGFWYYENGNLVLESPLTVHPYVYLAPDPNFVGPMPDLLGGPVMPDDDGTQQLWGNQNVVASFCGFYY